MKTLFKALTIAVLSALNVSLVSAQTNHVNAEQVAHAYLTYPVDHYTGKMWASTLTPSNTPVQIEIDFAMTKDLWITNASINQVNVPLPEPLGGLPIPVSGYTDVGFQLVAWDANGNWASQGFTNINFLPNQSSFSIAMYPHYPPVGVPVTTKDPGSIQVTLFGGNNGAGWEYDASLKEVIIYAQNVNGEPVNYQITDSSGLLAHGTLPFFQAPTGNSVQNMVVNPQQIGGVVEGDVDGPNWWLQGLKFDTTVLRTNVYVPAKVIDVPDIAYQSGLEVYVYGVAGSTIEIWSDTGDGPLQGVPFTVVSQNNDPVNGWTIITTPQYLDKAVVTIRSPAKGFPFGNTFQVGIYRNSGI